MSDLETIRKDLSAITPVSRETIERLDTYRQVLERWQARTNLVAHGTLDQFWTRHVADSLQVLPLSEGAVSRVDLGSGGGFPGLVLTIALRENGGRNVLIESSQKKCSFLREAARQTGANAEIVNGRIESVAERLADTLEGPVLVTARALAPLARLLELSHPLLRAGGYGIFHKGREYERELEECRGLWQFDMVRHRSRIEPDSVLLEIRNPVRLPV